MNSIIQLESKFADSDERPMTAREAAEYLGVHPRTLKRAATRGDIPGHFALNRWFFYASELDARIRASSGLTSGVESGRHHVAGTGGRQNVPA